MKLSEVKQEIERARKQMMEQNPEIHEMYQKATDEIVKNILKRAREIE